LRCSFSSSDNIFRTILKTILKTNKLFSFLNSFFIKMHQVFSLFLNEFSQLQFEDSIFCFSYHISSLMLSSIITVHERHERSFLFAFRKLFVSFKNTCTFYCNVQSIIENSRYGFVVLRTLVFTFELHFPIKDNKMFTSKHASISK
jgi:hypothetical protein